MAEQTLVALLCELEEYQRGLANEARKPQNTAEWDAAEVCKRAAQALKDYEAFAKGLQAGADSLRHALAVTNKNAQRYLWLRYGDNDELVLQQGMAGYAHLPRNEKLDEMIDAHMADEAKRIYIAVELPKG